jgi:hypothetical protein
MEQICHLIFWTTNINVVVFVIYYRSEEKGVFSKKTEQEKKKGQDIFSRTIELMKTGNDAWVELTEKVQYMMLGFHHDTEK